ncbi:hypothetical protein DPMN_129640 [Dreissena polymorpha]|uniref:Uncharacterized protein n=1 Tax=Dreissena polymorpha TaxID=45954 RepID=A0A9D4H666_DREPO|nr:hypothetical protein DPMN_129640 [Dreissena polymorpha]
MQLWVVHEERAKKVEERLSRIEDNVDGADIHASELAERVQELVKERDTLREDVSYLQSQSMRNNLVFTAKPEANGNVFETPEMTEAKLRQHLVSAFKLSQEVATSIIFERVHRSPGSPIHGKIRNIKAKFSFFKDREIVRKGGRSLMARSTGYSSNSPGSHDEKASISAENEGGWVCGLTWPTTRFMSTAFRCAHRSTEVVKYLSCRGTLTDLRM